MKKEYISPAVRCFDLNVKTGILTSISDPEGTGNNGGISTGLGGGEDSRENDTKTSGSSNIWDNQW